MIPAPGAEALSCYTANLAHYLSHYRTDALARVARSVRLAIRTDTPAPTFSHHGVALNDIDGRSHLAYAAAPDAGAALTAIESELREHGRVLVVANTSTMDWSVPEKTAAPHFLLIDGHRETGWHVDDRFVAPRPGGGEGPYSGWIPRASLVSSLTPIAPLPAHLRLRNGHAFGFAVPLPPDGQVHWLVRRRGRPPPPRLSGRWVTGIADVIDLLEAFWSDVETWSERMPFLDDMWAAAQHHTFRYRHLLSGAPPTGPELAAVQEAIRAWQDLPMALNFAASSHLRGRPRPTVVKATFERLREAELRGRAIAAGLGYTHPDP
jgi:hypothetical protein